MAIVNWLVIFEEADGERMEREYPLNPYARPDDINLGGVVYTYKGQDGLVPIYRTAFVRRLGYPRVVRLLGPFRDGGSVHPEAHDVLVQASVHEPLDNGAPVYWRPPGVNVKVRPSDLDPPDAVPPEIVFLEDDGVRQRAALWTRRSGDNLVEYRLGS